LFGKLVANPFPFTAYMCQMDKDWNFTRLSDGILQAFLTLD